MPGTFEDSGSGTWRLETAGPVFEAVAAFGDSAVVRLVDCMRDTTRARTIARGRAVLAGAMCYEALIHMAYYEAYDQRPDSAGKYEPWEGDLTPTANAKELLRAQSAWQMVVRAKMYRVL
jgi:hypothetical protein